MIVVETIVTELGCVEYHNNGLRIHANDKLPSHTNIRHCLRTIQYLKSSRDKSVHLLVLSSRHHAANAHQCLPLAYTPPPSKLLFSGNSHQARVHRCPLHRMSPDLNLSPTYIPPDFLSASFLDAQEHSARSFSVSVEHTESQQCILPSSIYSF